MSRKLRPYLPGAAFHLTARVAFKQHKFKRHEIRDFICESIADSLALTDARLLAFCVMTNHLHLIVAQGLAPLWRLMKPLDTRIALCVQRFLHIQGGVLGGPYHSFPCADASHLRRAIVYTHLNPYRTRLRLDADTYRWSSHSAYAGNTDIAPVRISSLVTRDLRLFAQTGDISSSSDDYLEHLNYWRHAHDCKLAQVDNSMSEPAAPSGDEWYRQSYVPAIQQLALAPKEDMRDIAVRTLETQMPDITLQMLRTRSRNRRIAAARKAIAIAAFTGGYPCGAIAEFLGLSSGRVSQMTSRVQTYQPPRVSLVRRVKAPRGK